LEATGKTGRKPVTLGYKKKKRKTTRNQSASGRADLQSVRKGEGKILKVKTLAAGKASRAGEVDITASSVKKHAPSGCRLHRDVLGPAEKTWRRGGRRCPPNQGKAGKSGVKKVLVLQKGGIAIKSPRSTEARDGWTKTQ